MSGFCSPGLVGRGGLVLAPPRGIVVIAARCQGTIVASPVVLEHGDPDLFRPWNQRFRAGLFAALLSALLPASLTMAMAAEGEREPGWQANYDARAAFLAANVGPLPEHLQKMVTLTGVWPGGGFFVIPAQRLDSKAWLYTTFGLSNPDMPAKTRLVEAPAGPDVKPTEEGQRAEAIVDDPTGAATPDRQAALEPPSDAVAAPNLAGYGYELAVLADPDEKWPLGFLQWAVDAEIVNDVGLLRQVEAEGGLTIETVRVGPARPIHVVVAKARPPLPPGADLPAGRMTLLIATAITTEEMRWSMEHGSAALVDKLVAAGVGQHSSLDRRSVVP